MTDFSLTVTCTGGGQEGEGARTGPSSPPVISGTYIVLKTSSQGGEDVPTSISRVPKVIEIGISFYCDSHEQLKAASS
jgi:hypothetical protein